MLRSLHIQNFRALREFKMSGLGRVNLLVGTNNCGKTSVLEAIHLLVDRSISPLLDAHIRRDELRTSEVIDLPQAFHGRVLQPGSSFDIDGDSVMLTAKLRKRRQGEQSEYAWDPSSDFVPVLTLDLVWGSTAELPETRSVPVDPQGGLPASLSQFEPPGVAPVVFVPSNGAAPTDVLKWLSDVVLTPDEEFITGALRSIEPSLERIAPVGGLQRSGSKIAVMINGQRAPIGSMGDGITRLLGVALGLIRSKAGVLLIDEIDTGLHYSVLEKMWRLVFETATRLDVQVFATTHSRDCYEALASVTREDRNEISIQRIERDKPEAIAFDEAEIRVAAERGIEVR